MTTSHFRFPQVKLIFLKVEELELNFVDAKVLEVKVEAKWLERVVNLINDDCLRENEENFDPVVELVLDVPVQVDV